MNEKKDKPTTFRTSQSVLDMITEMCEYDNRSRGRMIEYAVTNYYHEIFKKNQEED